MLSHKLLTAQDVGRAASYYEDSADDYFAKEGGASQWQGKGAEMLGLSGEVDPARLRELFAGQVEAGKPIARASTRDDQHTRIGIDLTFSAPKSVSIQALVGGDGTLLRAHEAAVERTLALAEEYAQARAKKQGKSRVESTGNLVVAQFRHETSRDRDPQLHTHAVVLNLTRRQDGEWRALRNDQIVKATKYLGAVYRAELAADLQKLGYSLRHEPNGTFELAQVSRAQLEQFSGRAAQIEEQLAKQGLTRQTATTAQKQLATLQTRERKGSIDRAALHAEWKARAAELKLSLERPSAPGELGRARDAIQDAAVRAEAASGAVRYAVQHLTERQAVVTRSDLLRTAMEHGVGSLRLAEVEAEIERRVAQGVLVREATLYRSATDPLAGAKTAEKWAQGLASSGLKAEEAEKHVAEALKSGRLVPDEPRFTTRTAVAREENILRIEREGRGQLEPVTAKAAMQKRLEGVSLTAGQMAAVELITTTRDRVVGVQGLAGTGKSHMLESAKAVLEESGYRVLALAPYSTQVRALRELGVEAKTVASILASKKEPHELLDSRSVLIVDEAGVVPARLMSRICTLAETTGARVVLLGDTAQTKAIEAGRPFEQLQKAGMATAKMEEIQRQTNPELKRAVELAAHGETSRSLAHVQSIHEVRDDHARRAAVAEAFAKLAPEERDRTLIVSGTNEARREINALVQRKVGTEGTGMVFATLARVDTTQAQRMFSRNYSVGSRIQPERDYPRVGLQRGSLYEVLDTGPANRLTVRDETGKTIQFNPLLARKLSVYDLERTELAPGDRVRITRNDATLDLANGDRAIVRGVSKDKVVLAMGERQVELPARGPLHVDLAYTTTVHSSQGTTADRVLIDAATYSRTTAKDVYYVAVSRARSEAVIFTNDRSQLPQAISRDNKKHAALDLQPATRAGVLERTKQEGTQRER